MGDYKRAWGIKPEDISPLVKEKLREEALIWLKDNLPEEYCLEYDKWSLPFVKIYNKNKEIAVKMELNLPIKFKYNIEVFDKKLDKIMEEFKKKLW